MEGVFYCCYLPAIPATYLPAAPTTCEEGDAAVTVKGAVFLYVSSSLFLHQARTSFVHVHSTLMSISFYLARAASRAHIVKRRVHRVIFCLKNVLAYSISGARLDAARAMTSFCWRLAALRARARARASRFCMARGERGIVPARQRRAPKRPSPRIRARPDIAGIASSIEK